jgi:glycogen debranching enzyme
LFAGIPSKEQAATIINTMMTKFGGDDMYYVFDPTSERFNPKKYWRGPVWINLNWILYNGLKDWIMMILLPE